MDEYYLEVRGYELDSFGHVNNAVYLNYLEEARWQILKKMKLLNHFLENELFLVVTELNIRYISEAKIFDKLVVRTDISRKLPFIIFNQNIINTDKNMRISKAIVTTLLVDKDRLPVDFPDNPQIKNHE